MALTDNLEAFWNLEDLTDSSGNSHTLTNNNGVTFAAGRINNAAIFTRASSRSLSIANGSLGALNPNASPYTVSAFFYGGPTVNGDTWGIISTQNGGSTGYKIQVSNSFGSLACRFFNDGVGAGNISVSQGAWHHAVLAVGADGSTAICVDGSFIDLGSVTPPAGSSANLTIGSTGASNYSDGKIDLVGFWSRKLSEAEMLQLYNSGAGLDPTDAPAAAPDAPTISGIATASHSLTPTIVPGSDGGSAVTATEVQIPSGTGSAATRAFQFEGIGDGGTDPDFFADATGNKSDLSGNTLVAAPVGYGIIPGGSQNGSESLLTLTSDFTVWFWRTISAGTIGADDNVASLLLVNAAGHYVELDVISNPADPPQFILSDGISGTIIFETSATGESLFAIVSNGTTVTVYYNGTSVGSWPLSIGTGESEGCRFTNGNAGSGDNPLLYSIGGAQSAFTAAQLLKMYNGGTPRPYADRNIVYSGASLTPTITEDANGVQLANGTSYGLQARQVNAVGNGAWSGTSSGTPEAPGPSEEDIRQYEFFGLTRIL